MKTLDTSAGAGAFGNRTPTPPHGPFMVVGNTLVKLLLRSLLHRWLSGNVLLLTYIGHKSGKRYTIPVSYMRLGDMVTVFAYRSRGWWKQVRANATVGVEIQRRRFDGAATVVADDEEMIGAGLLSLLCAHPSLASGYHVPLDVAGRPDPIAVRRVARYLVMARILITPTATGHAE
jgi:deazaflavin-dependent oxidoreductase (nitroreductase family)